MLRIGFPDSRANFSRKKLASAGNVFFVIAQRRNIDGDDVQPVVKIFAERAFFERGAQIAIRCGDQADIHFDAFSFRRGARIRAPAARAELHLRRGRHVADFVEEKRALVRQFEFSGLARDAPENAPFS